MAHTAIVGRQLDRPYHQLWLSETGRWAEIARLMAEVDAAAYVVDCVPNMTTRSGRFALSRLCELLKAAQDAGAGGSNAAAGFRHQACSEVPQTGRATQAYEVLIAEKAAVYYLEGNKLSATTAGTPWTARIRRSRFSCQAGAFSNAQASWLSAARAQLAAATVLVRYTTATLFLASRRNRDQER